MRYIVSLGWREEYEFGSGLKALEFASDAAEHTKDPNQRIEIRIKQDKDIEDEVIAAVIDDVAAELEEDE